MDSIDELKNLRDEVRKVTVEIIRLCGERFALARKIGETKIQKGLPIEDMQVEENLKQEILGTCHSLGIEREFGLRLLDLLFEESKRVQKGLLLQRKSDK